jgi:hypothetical protein
MFHLLLNFAIAESDGSIGELAPARIMANDHNGSLVPVNLISKDFTNVPSSLGI